VQSEEFHEIISLVVLTADTHPTIQVGRMNDYSMEDEESDPSSGVTAYGGGATIDIDGGGGHPPGAVMTVQAQKERRNSIRNILADEALTPLEKRRSIQSLMDGRRRSLSSHTRSSSGSQGEMGGAATAAMEFYPSDLEGGDALPSPFAVEGANGDQHYQHSPPPPSQPNADYGYGLDAPAAAQESQAQSSSPQNDINNSANHEQPFQAHSQHPVGSGGRKQRSSSMPLWSEDTSRAAAPLVAASSNAVWDDPLNVSRRMEKSRPPCGHYERNCTIVSPCCGLAFGCRICHDECPVLPPPFPRNDAGDAGASAPRERVLNWDAAVGGVKHKQEKRRSLPLSYEEQETHHEINRFAIAEIICRLCYSRQSSKT
jgi:hypothetical protein